MADGNKELLKKDLVTILQLNKKTHYDNIEELEKVRTLLIQRKVLHTSLGNKYLKRLQQIIDGENDSNCLLCNGNMDNSTIICNSCINKFSGTNNQNISSQTVHKEDENNSKEELRKKLQTTTEQASRLTEIAEQKTKDFIDKKTKEIKDKPNKKLSKKTKVILGVFLALIILGALLDNGDGSGSEREAISNGNQAYAIVQEFYSLDEFYISLNETASVPKEIFNGKVGKQVDQDAFMGEEQIGVYCFGVTSKDGQLDGQVWVSENGGVVQLGLEGNGFFYLIR